TMAGSLHPVDDDWLARARADFPALGALPSPRIAVLVGGPSTHADLEAADLDALMATAESIAAAEGGSLLATTSRRTPAPVRAALHRRAAMDVPSSPAHAGQVPMLAWTGD